jgi:peptidoglycan/LPS O-acetylase OafA/YrhL
MENPIPDSVAGVKTITWVLAWIGAAYAQSRSAPVSAARAGSNILLAAIAGVLAGLYIVENWPDQKIGSYVATLFTALLLIPLLPVLQDKATELIRNFRIPGMKE